MKKIISLVTIGVFALTFGLAFADEMPGSKARESGAYYGETTLKHDIGPTEWGVKGAAPGGVREEKVRKEDKSSIIFKDLFGLGESKDLP